MPGGPISTERLLERGDELAALSDAVAAVVSGRGTLVLVGGEAGIGKTSLVRALRAGLNADITFALGACEALSVPVPLGPWREIAAAVGEDDFGVSGEDRLLLTRRLSVILAELAPAVVVIEDAHWSDPLSLDLVRMMARRVEELAVAILVTYRTDEVPANHGLELLIGDLATSPAVRRLALRPLSEAAVRELSARTGLNPSELARVTGGNPFLVVEAVAAGTRLPASVRDAVLARAGRLGPAARRVVDAAAVIGQRFDPPLLEAVAPSSGDAVEEALARGVLIADGDGLGFRHELIREALEASVAPARRAQLHAEVVAALVKRPAGIDNARLAHHAELGGLDADAARYARAAALDAARIGALVEVRRQADRALRLEQDFSPQERFDLLIRYSRAANFTSPRLEDGADAAERALAVARAMNDPVRQGQALLTLAYSLWSMDRLHEAKSAAEQAVALMKSDADPDQLAQAYSTRIRVEATSFDPAVALASGPAALKLAIRSGNAETRLDIEISLALAQGHQGDEGALDHLSECIQTARSTGLAIQTVRAYVNLVYVAGLLRRHEVLERRAAEAGALFDEYGTPIPGFAVELYRGRSLADRGRWEEALAIAGRADRDWLAENAVALTLQGLIAARRGWPEAEQLLEDAWEKLAGVPESSRHGTVRVARVEAAWLRGDAAGALSQLRAAQTEPATARFARSGGELALWARRYGIELGVPAGAPEPVRLELEGDWRAAITAWNALQAPYEAALAALPGDESAAREALGTLYRLGARGAAAAFTRQRSASGAPLRGPRRSTLSHPAGLTRREQQVLDALATGAGNPGIARALHLSERTVAHHVSAILRKLDVPNRVSAIDQARRRGLLTEDGQVSESR